MKNVMIIACFLLAGCEAFEPSVEDFICGTYVMEAEGKYSKAFDTIRIANYDENSHSYIVSMHSGFHRIQSGKLQPKQYKSKEIVMQYNPSTEKLEDNQSARQLTFAPEKNTLLFGAAEYRKIK